MQCSEGKKATDLAIILMGTIGVLPINVNKSSDPKIIEEEKADLTHNLLLCAATNYNLQTFLIMPTQETKQMFQEEITGKSIKLGMFDVNAQTRHNPDTSVGLFCSDKIRDMA